MMHPKSILVDRGPFRRVALQSYMSQMSSPNPKGLFDDHVAEILEQQGFAWEESPRSVYDPQQLYTALQRYATDWSQFEELDDSLEYGFRKAYKIFAKIKGEKTLDPLTDSEVVTRALKLNKSAGLPLMVSKEKSLTYSFDRERQIRLGIKSPNPCVAYKRTQKENKTRLVWGYPLEMTIMEARFARPLIERFKRHATPMAFGMSKVELGAKLHCYFKNRPGRTVCLDYSKYDSTLSASMIRQAFRILATWFDKEDIESLGWRIIVEYFVSTPIVMPDGHLYTGKKHGVPSGSYFTQMIDSICNVALCYALQHKCGMQFNDRSLYVLGDDVIVQVKSQVELEKWAAQLSKWGLILHDDDKTRVDELHFLGAVWDMGKPDAPIDELVNKACFPETYRDYQGNPEGGALSVLRSYAANYISAFRLIPYASAHIRNIDYPYRDDEYLRSDYLSGSDKYFMEERTLEKFSQKNTPEPTLAYRISV